jgi:hypothetical protein
MVIEEASDVQSKKAAKKLAAKAEKAVKVSLIITGQAIHQQLNDFKSMSES